MLCLIDCWDGSYCTYNPRLRSKDIVRIATNNSATLMHSAYRIPKTNANANYSIHPNVYSLLSLGPRIIHHQGINSILPLWALVFAASIAFPMSLNLKLCDTTVDKSVFSLSEWTWASFFLSYGVTFLNHWYSVQGWNTYLST